MITFKTFILLEASLPEFIETDSGTNVGYHYGDLGIGWDTTRKHMSGGRGTGHFGTGVYFLGKPLNKGGFYGSRPEHRIDFSKFKLFKPSDPREFHKALKIINQLVGNDESLATEIFGKVIFSSPVHKAAFILWVMNPCGPSEKELEKIITDEIEKEREGKLSSGEIRTAPTRIMQRLGYDGIDVRGTELDNTDYGSVIYPKVSEGNHDNI